MSRFTNSITAFRITQPADTPIWPAIIFTRDNTALGRLTLRRVIAFVGADFRALLRFSLTSPFFTSMVQESSCYFILLFHSHNNVQSHNWGKARPVDTIARQSVNRRKSPRFCPRKIARDCLRLVHEKGGGRGHCPERFQNRVRTPQRASLQAAASRETIGPTPGDKLSFSRVRGSSGPCWSAPTAGPAYRLYRSD